MTSTPSGAPDGADDTDGTDASVLLAVSREQLVVALIVVAQALWLGLVMLRGWYSAADLPNIAYATGRPLGWDYLSSTLGGHFGVAQRSIYWLLNRAAPLEWWVTVVLRLVFQALATVLLWRLLRALVGYRPWLFIVLALYASSAYLVPGLAALNSGLGLSISQACLVGALLAHVRYHRGRRLADAAVAAVLVLLMLAFAQGSLPTLVIFPVVSIAFLSTGPWRGRLADELTLWPGWALLAGALAVLAAFYVIGGDYNSPSSEFTPRDALWMVGQAWVAVLGAALLGGPWSYYVLPDQWSAYADVPIVLAVAGQLALLALVVLSVRRTGPVALVAWAIPAWVAVDQPAAGRVESVVLPRGEHPRRDAIQPLPPRRARPGCSSCVRLAARPGPEPDRRRAGHAGRGAVRARPPPGGGRHWVGGGRQHVLDVALRRGLLGQPCAGLHLGPAARTR